MVQQALCRLSKAGAVWAEPSIPGKPEKGSTPFGTNPAQLPLTDEDQFVHKPMHKTPPKKTVTVIFKNLFGLLLQVPQNLSESLSQTDSSTSPHVWQKLLKEN